MHDIHANMWGSLKGSDGMCILGSHRRFHKVSALTREVYDVTGAGDTVIATLALAMTAGGSPLSSCQLAKSYAKYRGGESGHRRRDTAGRPGSAANEQMAGWWG